MKYYTVGRLFPTLLTAPPVVSVYLFIVSPFLVEAISKVMPLVAQLSKIALPTVIVFFLTLINKFLSKSILQSVYFKGENSMPTTDFLLYTNEEYSTATKNRIRDKIKDYFGLTLYSPQKEASNEKEARLLIKEAVGRIRNLLRGDEMIFRHNVEYGMMRNFLGGCIQASFFGLVIVVCYFILPKDEKLLYLGIAYIVLYGFFLTASKFIMKRFGNDYARILYQQFLSHIK